MSPRAARGDTTARIITATFALLAERGLAGITMSGIATRAGVARQTLYSHFPDVDSIVAAALAEHHQEDLHALASMLDTIPSATGRLNHLVRHVTVTAGHHGTLPALHAGLSPAAARAAHDYDQQIRRLIRDVLTSGQRAGEFPATIDPDVHAVLIHHLLGGAAELAAARPDEVAVVAEATIRLLPAAADPAT